MAASSKATRVDRTRPKYKSKWESAYAIVLEALLRAGEILFYEYEGIKLRIAEGAWYTPDFFVVAKDGTMEVHEVKGHWREAAKVRWKVVKETFPFVFKLVKKSKGGFVAAEE